MKNKQLQKPTRQNHSLGTHSPFNFSYSLAAGQGLALPYDTIATHPVSQGKDK